MMESALSLEQKLHIVFELQQHRRAIRRGLMPAPLIKPPWWESLTKDQEQRIYSEMKVLIRENKGMEKNDKY